MKNDPIPLMVSVSGVRGVVGQSFTPDVVRRYVQAFSTTLSAGATVVLGRDSRTSGPWVTDLAAATLQAMGHHAVMIGLCGTPTLGYAIRALKADAGVMVTASHNPVDWNALKLLGSDGGFVSPAMSKKIYRAADRGTGKPADYRGVGHRSDSPELVDIHLKAIVGMLPRSRRQAKLRVVLDTVNGAGSVLVPRFLEGAGCELTVINGDPTGIFAHAPEPVSGNLKQLSRAVRKYGADLGIAVDPDVDRVAFVDETGRPAGEELSLGMSTAYVLSWRPGPVVVNLSTSRVSQDMARSQGVKFYRTPVGEAHVAAKMKAVGAAIGGEGNGGVIYPRLHPGRDALAGIAFVLALLRKRRAPFSQVVSTMPVWTLVRSAIPVPRAYERQLKRLLAALPKGKVDRRDGIRVDWPDGWIQMRKSNTEPIVRILAEAKTKSAAQALIDTARELVSDPT